MDIIVVGYPRSGNVWLSRLLGDILDRPVIGVNGALSLATEGKDRPGPGRVMQAHKITPPEGAKAVFLVRDPRDVLVSVAAFWDWPLDKALSHMVKGPGPLDLPPWSTYVEGWLAKRTPVVRYRDLYHDTVGILYGLLSALEETPRHLAMEVAWRQSFTVKKADIKARGNQYPFGQKAQLRHLRKGTTGEWRTLPDPIKRQAQKAWGPLLSALGYEGV